MEKEQLMIGNSFTLRKVVEESDTSLNYGSGQLEKLFATPSLVSLMIKAAVSLIDPALPEGFITVGKQSSIIHEKPTFLGETVNVTVMITGIDGPKINLEMEASDELGFIGRGTHERHVVNKNAFLGKVKEIAKDLETRDF